MAKHSNTEDEIRKAKHLIDLSIGLLGEYDSNDMDIKNAKVNLERAMKYLDRSENS
jgi:hypothetical protein